MTNNPHEEGQAFAEFLQGLSFEERNEENQRQLEQTEAEHQDFQQAFREENCYLCNDTLSSFESVKPCLHWLLRPTGFTKRHFIDVTDKYGCFQIQSYLRWIANEELLAQNINDLSFEGTGKLIELTIRYKTFEWAFSCGESDYQGHQTKAPESQHPHYHFQMRTNRAAFIRYNDFHIPLSQKDIIDMEAMRKAPDIFKKSLFGGEGMSDLLNNETIEDLISSGMTAGDEEEALFKLDSFVVANKGKTISGDDISKLIEEAKTKGVTLASLLPKLPNTKIQTIVTPGPSVVEQATRSGRRKQKY